MTTTLRPAPVSYRQLDWDATTRRFSADISSTRGLGQVYDDSCDEGLTIVGATGREVVFVVANVRTDVEGDIQSWELRPAHPADRGLVAGVTLWND